MEQKRYIKFFKKLNPIFVALSRRFNVLHSNRQLVFSYSKRIITC